MERQATATDTSTEGGLTGESASGKRRRGSALSTQIAAGAQKKGVSGDSVDRKTTLKNYRGFSVPKKLIARCLNIFNVTEIA